jgi:DnaJ domain
MIWLAIGLGGLVLVLLGLRAFVHADPKRLARMIPYAGMALCGLAATYLIATGRFGLAMMVGAGAVALARRVPGGFPGFGWGGWRLAGAPPPPGQKTEVRTSWLHMTLDHDTSEVAGMVLQGKFQGHRIEELAPEQVMELLLECRLEDAEGAALLESYLDRVAGADWRQRAGHGPAAPSDGKMTPDEARAVLGVGADATADDIRAAYHRLMKKIHPDQGGSNYLASKLNAAKAVLLGE